MNNLLRRAAGPGIRRIVIISALGLGLNLRGAATLCCQENQASPPMPTVFSYPVEPNDINAPLWRVAQRLNARKVLRGEFSQEKQIAVLRRPLISKGRFIFCEGRGLWWRVDNPVVSESVFSTTAIFQKRADGSSRDIIAEGQTVARGFLEVFAAVFAGDSRSLKQNFALSFAGREQDWRIGLIPHDRTIKRFLRYVMLSGTDFINQLEIREVNADISVIKFTNVAAEPAALQPEEERYFER